MSHFTRTQTTAVWTNGGAEGYITLLADWQNLNDKVFASMNGIRGGTWTPSSPIIIDTSGLKVSGPADVNFGGSIRTLSGARFVLGAGDYPKLGAGHVGQKREIRQDLTIRMATPRYHWLAAVDYIGAIQSIACTINGASGLEQPRCAIPLKVHDGGRITGARLTFRIPTARTIAPIAMPKIRLVRTDIDGVLVPMTSSALGADADGYVSPPKPTTGPAWYAGGAAQKFEIPCDQNNTVDCSQYLYYAELIEEVGTNVVLGAGSGDGSVVRERKAIVYKVYTTSGTTLAGVPGGLADGDPVLTTAELTPANNGLWRVHSGSPGTWTRREDAATSSQFSPGFLVPDQATGDMWELGAVPAQPFGIKDLIVNPNGADLVFQRRLPRGNIYHALTVHHDSIMDMRPQ